MLNPTICNNIIYQKRILIEAFSLQPFIRYLTTFSILFFESVILSKQNFIK